MYRPGVKDVTTILLINPWAGEVFPTPAIGYLQAAVKAARPEVKVTAADMKVALQLLEKNSYDLVGVTYHSFSVKYARQIRAAVKGRLVCGGHHPSALPQQMLDIGYDQVVVGEGENALIAIIDGDTRPIISGYVNPFALIDELPFPDYTGLSWSGAMGMPIISSRGCPFNCLHGDTLIDTTDGYFKIKDLVGKQPNVLTRNPITHIPEYAKATEVRLTQRDARLVRVNFDNGDYIDCTPDHKFMTFKNGNQSCVTREVETEAKDLKVGESVRAIHYSVGTGGYVDIVYGRRKRKRQHRLVVENRIGRELTNDEHIHHIDRNSGNNKDSNLILTNKSDHIHLYHPEIAERMRVNNAAKNMTREQRVINAKKSIGSRRSLESRLRYRDSKLGVKNPRYTDGKSKHKSRIPEVNHKVVSVEYLDQKADVFCMEVPGYDWFYANQVLVHNCTFCGSVSFWGRKWKMRQAEDVLDEIAWMGLKTFMFEDDNFTVDKKRALKICDGIKGKGYSWQCNSRAETLVDEELCRALKDAGCETVWCGIESFSQKSLNRSGKRTTVEKMLAGIEMADKVGLEIMAQFIVGLPDDTEADIKLTVETIKKSKIKRKGVQKIWIVPNTLAHDRAKAKGFDDEVFLKTGSPYYTYEQDMATLDRWYKMIDQA